MEFGKCKLCNRNLSAGDYFLSNNKTSMACVRKLHASITGAAEKRRSK